MTAAAPVRHVGGTARREAETGTGYHGPRCWCGKRARWHVMYGSGCGHVCGEHKRQMTATRRGTAVTAL